MLEEYARTAFSNMRNYVDWGKDGVKLKSVNLLDEDLTEAVAAVSETKTK